MIKRYTFSRRNFFKKAGIGIAAAVGLPAMASSCVLAAKEISELKHALSEGGVILFQGDSITDAGRDRKRELPNEGSSFGTGYAYIIASYLLGNMPEKNLAIYNRGISGNKVYQLGERWQKDCLDLKPDILSILIGVNDYWHMRNGNYDGTPEVYEKDFRALLSRTKEELPEVKLVICQPFVLAGTSAVDESWLGPFSAYQSIAAGITKEFDAVWVPFQKAFDGAVEMAQPTYWTADGVHPSMAGAQLMAEAWLKAVL